ncbi:MAG TPA: TonB-dependent receptor [Steroidobacteraceae bacterium]
MRGGDFAASIPLMRRSMRREPRRTRSCAGFPTAAPAALLAALSLTLQCRGIVAAAEEQSVLKADQSAPEEKLEEVVVTGSRIARPEPERPLPTMVVTSQYIEQRAFTNVIDALDELPAFVQPDSSRVGNQGAFGLGQSFVDLFSLGSQRTLVLVDGRRFVPSNTPGPFGPTQTGGEQVDLNVIPTLLVDRIETTSVGGAAVYGSDAIAGTVNIILKHNFEGLDLDALGGTSGRGDADTSRLRLIGGRNFSDGRGNVEVNAELVKSQGLIASQRPRYAQDPAFIEPTGPSPYFFILAPNQRIAGLSTSGVPLVDDGFLNANPNFGIHSPSGQLLSFNQGHLLPYFPGPSDGAHSSNIGGDGLDQSPFTALLSPEERINGTLLASLTLNEHARLFGEFWYSETHMQQQTAISFISGDQGAPAGTVDGNLILSVNNAFLPSADRQTILNNLAAYASIPGNPTQKSVFYLSRVDVDAQSGGGTADQNTRRVVFGIDGEVPVGGKDLHYEVSGNYGRSVNTSVTPQINFQNFLNALQAVPGAGGSVVCAPGYRNSPYPSQASVCAPFNPFGFGLSSKASLDYVTSLAQATSLETQRVLNAYLTGDIATVPGGPVGIALGYENRRESAAFEPDQFWQNGAGNAGPIEPVAGAFMTNEVFGELLVPIVSARQHLALVHEFAVEGAVREVAHSVAGRSTTWTAGLRFEPVSILQFRGNYTRAIRAPTITEAFTPTSQAFSTIIDPCDQIFVHSGPNPRVRAANCAAAGVHQPFDSMPGQDFISVAFSGNPSLRNEVADSRAYGFVVRPLSRLSFSADYIDIDLEQAIQPLDESSILDMCYDTPQYPSAACSNIQRDAAGRVSFVRTTYANLGFLKFHGFVTELDWSLDVPGAAVPGTWGTLDFKVDHLYDQLLSFSVGASDHFDAQGLVTVPREKAALQLSWTRQKISIFWQTTFIGHALFAHGLPPDFANVGGVGNWWVHNLTLGYDPTSHFRVQLVVDNVFDRSIPFPLPAAPPAPLARTGIGTYFAGTLGRYFLLSAHYKL